MRKYAVAITTMTLLMLLFTGSAFAQQINIEVKEHILDNGMKFLVVENHDAPVFSTIIKAKVGAVDENSGQTGLTHFLEHMLFKGTKIFGTTDYQTEVPLMAAIDSVGELMLAEWKKLQDPLNYPPDSSRYKALRQEIADIQDKQKQYIVKDELWEAYLKNGGSGLNASTGSDATQFYVSLPANRLELWMLLESDRFRNIIFREFYSERDVVYEERRSRTDNNAFGRLYEQFGAAAFTAAAYQHPVIGWASDIQSWDHPLLLDYYHTYYSPNNLIAVICGDVDAGQVFKLAEKYFSGWERGPEPPRQTTFEPEQDGERRIQVEFDANPSLLIGYHIPAAGHPDIAALDALSDILSRGRTSRLYKSIVEEKKIASSVNAGSAFSRYPSLFTFNGSPLKGRSTEELEEAIYEEIEKLKNEPVSQWELEKIKNQFDAYMIGSVNSNMGMCWRLANYDALTGSWDYINTYWKLYKAVTADDLMRVANTYLDKSNRTVAVLVKPEKEEQPEETLSDVSGL